MKVWRFYDKANKSHSDYVLYAITNNKKIAKEFIATRNMDRYIMRKSDIDKEDWINFADDNRGCVIEIHELDTRVKGKSENMTVKIKVPMTYYEYQTIDLEDGETFLTSEMWLNAPPYLIFNDSMIDALRNVEYVAAQRFFDLNMVYFLQYVAENDSRIDFDEEESMVSFGDEEGDYAAPELYTDQLVAFIRMYKDHLRSNIDSHN